MNLKSIGALLLALSTTTAWADIRVEQPYARATVPGQMAGGGYLQVEDRQITILKKLPPGW